MAETYTCSVPEGFEPGPDFCAAIEMAPAPLIFGLLPAGFVVGAIAIVAVLAAILRFAASGTRPGWRPRPTWMWRLLHWLRLSNASPRAGLIFDLCTAIALAGALQLSVSIIQRDEGATRAELAGARAVSNELRFRLGQAAQTIEGHLDTIADLEEQLKELRSAQTDVTATGQTPAVGEGSTPTAMLQLVELYDRFGPSLIAILNDFIIERGYVLDGEGATAAWLTDEICGELLDMPYSGFDPNKPYMLEHDKWCR